MLDVIFAIVIIVLCVIAFNILIKEERELADKRLRLEIEKARIIIEELKK